MRSMGAHLLLIAWCVLAPSIVSAQSSTAGPHRRRRIHQQHRPTCPPHRADYAHRNCGMGKRLDPAKIQPLCPYVSFVSLVLIQSRDRESHGVTLTVTLS